MHRALRRKLERRADALLARSLDRLRGTPIDPGALVLAREGDDLIVVDRIEAGFVLGVLDVGDVLAAIDATRPDAYPIPVVLMLRCGWLSVAWTDAAPMVLGGAA